MKMISTLNAKRTYDDIGHSNFDKIVKMAEIIIDSTIGVAPLYSKLVFKSSNLFILIIALVFVSCVVVK